MALEVQHTSTPDRQLTISTISGRWADEGVHNTILETRKVAS